MPKIYVFSVPSGGSGKTTLSGNGAYYSAEKKQEKTLLMDVDQSCSLTDRMIKTLADKNGVNYMELLNSIDDDTYTVKAIFDGGNPNPLVISENLDFIAGYNGLTGMAEKVKSELSWKAFDLWLRTYEKELSVYDRIIIDTHNDEVNNIFLTSAYMVADKVIVVLPVDDTVYKKINQIEERVSLMKRLERDTVKAEVVVVGNKFSANPSTKSGEKAFQMDFIKKMVDQPQKYIGYFDTRKFFASFKTTGQTLVEQEKKKHGQSQSDKAFFKRTWKLYDKIFDMEEGK